MIKLNRIALAVALLAAGASVHAQSTVNEERCRQLAADMDKALSQAVAARVPTQSPAKAVEDAVDIKSLLAVDTSAGFTKLVSTGFNRLMDSLIQKGMDTVNRKANQAFTNNINGILQKNGIAPMLKNTDLSPVTNQITKTTGQVGQAARAAVRTTTTPTPSSNPYDRP